MTHAREQKVRVHEEKPHGRDAPRHPGEKGSLAVAVLSVALVLMLVFTFLARSGGERRLTAQLLAVERSRAAGEAAIAEALWSVQKTMNTSGDWFRQLRQPPAAAAATLTAVPSRALGLLREMAGGQTVRLDCTLRLLGATPLPGGPCEPGEKLAYLEAEVAVGIDGVERKLRRVREARVVRCGPPPPLDSFTSWVFSGPGAGAVRAPGGLPGTAPAPLDPAARQTIEGTWTYNWGSRRNRFPFLRSRVSEYYADWKSFLDARLEPGGDLRLSGVVLVADTADGQLSGCRLRGNGALWVPDASVRLSGVGTAPGELPQVVVLGPGKRLELTGYPTGATVRAWLAVPDGTLVTEPGLTLEGGVYADRWQAPSGTVLRAALPPDPFLATLSEVSFALPPRR